MAGKGTAPATARGVGLLLPASLAAVSLAGLVAGLASIARRHLDVPVGGERRITFSAEPGSYEFYCRVPGHRQAGMVGTLRVG
jgi:plastocyanin